MIFVIFLFQEYQLGINSTLRHIFFAEPHRLCNNISTNPNNVYDKWLFFCFISKLIVFPTQTGWYINPNTLNKPSCEKPGAKYIFLKESNIWGENFKQHFWSFRYAKTFLSFFSIYLKLRIQFCYSCFYYKSQQTRFIWFSRTFGAD